MALFTITYRPETGLPPEQVDADDVRVESAGQVVLRRSVLVVGQPREIVVRRLTGAQVLSVESAAQHPHRSPRATRAPISTTHNPYCAAPLRRTTMRPIRARATVVSLLLTVTAVAAVGFASPALAQTLRPGSSGPAVSCWQKKLRWVSLARPTSRVPLISVNARYDSPTTNATKAFQRAARLTPDGVAGDGTQTQMLAELGTAARDKADQYASALYYGRCSTPEPMVCRKVNGAPKIVKNPNDSNPQSIRYYYSVGCTHLDSGLTDQTAVLYLIDPQGRRTPRLTCGVPGCARRRST